MKIANQKRPGGKVRLRFTRARVACLGAAAFALAAANLIATPVVTTVTGGPSYGYVDGDTHALALFHTPIGMALDSSGSLLYVADRDNNAVRKLDLDLNQTITFLPNDVVPANKITKPVGVVVDRADNLYVLNRGNGNNGTVLKFDPFGSPVATNAVALINANAIAIDYFTNIYVTVEGNKVKRIDPGGTITTVATVTIANTLLQGIAVTSSGSLAVCDSGRHGILLINPSTGVITTNTGFNGAGDHFGTKANVKFNQPYGVAAAGSGVLVVTDFGNHRVKVVDSIGTVTNLYGVCSSSWVTGSGTYPGWWDGNGCPSEITCQICANYAEARQPAGVLLAGNGNVYTTEDYYHLIRKVTGAILPPLPPPRPGAPTILTVTTNFEQVTLTWSTVSGATNYVVRRSPSSGGPYTIIAITSGTTYTDTSVINGTTYYYVVSAVNAGGEGDNSAEVSATPPMRPVTDPQIGYVTYPPPFGESVFHAVSSVVFNNDADIVIIGEAGTQTFYTYSNTLNAASFPDPTSSSASAPVGYIDGLPRSRVVPLTVASVVPALTIKAIGQQPGRPNSAIATAQFQFIVGNPLIVGNNAAHFTVSDITEGAGLWFTTDGSDPTNAAPSQFAGTITGTNAITLSLSFPSGSTNMTFKVRGFRTNYQPSGVVSNIFSAANFDANKISFGLTTGEPSSKFLARPGQVFYAPVTLSVLPGVTMYSMQFNAVVTNGLTNPNTGVRPPAIQNGAGLDFFSTLMSRVPPVEGTYFPPADGQWYLKIPPYLYQAFTYLTTNLDGTLVTNYTAAATYRTVFTNTANNLLGVGWLYRTGFRYLFLDDPTGERNIHFDTTAQDLIQYSIAHDTLFNKANGVVVLGAYSFQVPTTAVVGDKYFMQLGSPSATSDGVGAPGADIYIQPPATNKAVTVANTSYLVGDVAPFRWFNAGDFGNSNLLNDDVMQVYQSAILNVDMPPENSDFFTAMDSCGTLGTFDSANGYYTNSGPMTPLQIQAMFDGSDLTINQVAFGDGPPLDVCDVFVTFRRSLDPSLYWFTRFWTNNQFVAVTTPNLAFNSNTPSLLLARSSSADSGTTEENGLIAYEQSFVTFTAGDAVASAGQTLQIPITAKIVGDYPLRVLGLNITVRPLDGSPALTQAIQFTPAAALGQATLPPVSKHAGNYGAAWLKSDIAGLTGDTVIGTLTVKVPTTTTSSAAYAVHFDHVSASPNGIASFPKRTQTGLITRSDRSTSSWNDGIPDSWRLRYFGTINNLLSAASADADGDGASNWYEYKAGTDPNDAASVLRLRSSRGPAQDFVIRWPSAANKQYIVERSPSLTTPTWTAISTNAGTGADIEFHDNSNGPPARFYRVSVAP